MRDGKPVRACLHTGTRRHSRCPLPLLCSLRLKRGCQAVACLHHQPSCPTQVLVWPRSRPPPAGSISETGGLYATLHVHSQRLQRRPSTGSPRMGVLKALQVSAELCRLPHHLHHCGLLRQKQDLPAPHPGAATRWAPETALQDFFSAQDRAGHQTRHTGQQEADRHSNVGAHGRGNFLPTPRWGQAAATETGSVPLLGHNREAAGWLAHKAQR